MIQFHSAACPSIFKAVVRNDEGSVRALIANPSPAGLQLDAVVEWALDGAVLSGSALCFAVYVAASPTIIGLLLDAGANRERTMCMGSPLECPREIPLVYVLRTRADLATLALEDPEGRSIHRDFWIERFGQAPDAAWFNAVEQLLNA